MRPFYVLTVCSVASLMAVVAANGSPIEVRSAPNMNFEALGLEPRDNGRFQFHVRSEVDDTSSPKWHGVVYHFVYEIDCAERIYAQIYFKKDEPPAGFPVAGVHELSETLEGTGKGIDRELLDHACGGEIAVGGENQ